MQTQLKFCVLRPAYCYVREEIHLDIFQHSAAAMAFQKLSEAWDNWRASRSPFRDLQQQCTFLLSEEDHSLGIHVKTMFPPWDKSSGCQIHKWDIRERPVRLAKTGGLATKGAEKGKLVSPWQCLRASKGARLALCALVIPVSDHLVAALPLLVLRIR